MEKKQLTDDEQTILVETIRGAVKPLEGVVIEKLYPHYEPHPYCITPSHLQGDRMYLDGEAIRDAEKNHNAKCGMYCDPNDAGYCRNGPPRKSMDRCRERCTLPYDEHTVKYAILLDLSERIKSETAKDVQAMTEADEEFREWLKSLVPILEANKVIGFALHHKAIS